MDQDSASNPSTLHTNHVGEDLCVNNFMMAASSQVVDDAIAEFIDRTSNSVLACGACVVCARETNLRDLRPYRIDEIPSPHRLKPVNTHPRHNIFDGMLLHPGGLTNDGRGNLCIECFNALDGDRIPALALANGLWIGDIPHALAFLTLPERLLIAKYFPAAYIVKLYPKKRGARHWDKRQMYSGMKGNVSTYQLDQTQIASMIDGSVLPQTAEVLAATIGVTFVRPKNLPDSRGLPDMFRVRRSRVQTALEWLKEHNPLFSNIVISASRLADLPEDGVPYELPVRATTKCSSDVSTLYAEQDGYVPSQDAHDGDSDGGKPFFFPSILWTSQFSIEWSRIQCG